MHSVSRLHRLKCRWLACCALLLMVVALAGCFDKQATQRKAFIGFLQNTVLRSGETLPVLSADQQKQFGEFTAYYSLLYDYSRQANQAMNEGLQPMVQAVNTIRQPQDYLAQRDNLRQLSDALAVLNQQLNNAKTQANDTQSTLKFDDDLRPVYAQAYAKIVTTPATTLQSLLPAAQTLAQQLVQVGDFIAEQGTDVQFNSDGVQFASQQQVERYNALIAPLTAQYQAFSLAYRAAGSAMQ